MAAKRAAAAERLRRERNRHPRGGHGRRCEDRLVELEPTPTLTCAYPLCDSFSFELSYGLEDGHLETHSRGGGVDSFVH